MVYRFANCRLDPARHLLLRDGEPVHVEPQVFALLQVLAERAGQLITKDELVETVWRGLAISDATISARISAARKAIGDTGRAQAILKTVHGCGFRLVAPVSTDQAGGPDEAQSRPASAKAPRHVLRFAQSADGSRIAHAQSGEGPPLLRLGHWLSNVELDWHCPVWQPLLTALGARHRLVRYDQRGTGLSTRDLHAATGAGITPFVEDLLCVADANGLTRFPIFAASQAVPVAIGFAAQFPERVSGLILYGGYSKGRALRPPAPGQMDEATVLSLIRAGWGQPRSAFMTAFSSLFMPDATPEQLASFITMQVETIAPDKAAELRQIVDRFDVADLLGTIRAPTLVFHALDDAIHPVSEGRQLACGIPGARFVPLRSRNHVPLPQEPAWHLMLDEIDGFLSELEAGGPKPAPELDSPASEG